MAFVFRVENSEGVGMYCLDVYIEAYQSHPCPSRDGLKDYFGYHLSFKQIEKNRKEYFFGFKSIDQLYSWLYLADENLRLREDGAMISWYKIDKRNVRYGINQIIFKKNKAILVERITLYLDKASFDYHRKYEKVRL